MKHCFSILRMLRPHQWVKNLFVLAPAVFAKELLMKEVVGRSLAAFAGFCFAASAIYIFNDLVDRHADRVHPVKCQRPIASGAVNPTTAIVVALGLVGLAILVGYLLSTKFLLLTLAYIVLNLAYSLRLKNIAYIDALCIASGFELRVLAGAAAVEVNPSTYLMLVTFVLALFLAFGKRGHELAQGKAAYAQRSSLRGYTPRIVQGALYTTAIVTILTYAAYTLDPVTQSFFQTKYFYITTVFVVFGVGRFIVLIHRNNVADSPTEKMLTDIPFIMNVVLWCGSVVALIY